MQENFMILANEPRKLEKRVTMKGLESQIIEAAQCGHPGERTGEPHQHDEPRIVHWAQW